MKFSAATLFVLSSTLFGVALSSDDKARQFYMKQKLGSNKVQEDGISDNSQIEVKIVGGDESQVGEFPYYVYMQGHMQGSSYFCGGTLIAPNVVLSAAHCGSFVGETVYVSGYQRGTTNYNAVAVKVVDGAMHPQYNSDTKKNDFYLHYLEQEVFPNSQITLTLNTDGATPADGQDLTVLGLGRLTGAGGHPDILRDVVVPTVSNSFCSSEQSYGEAFDRDVMLCAGEPGKDSCQGDSGGPIVVRDNNNHVLVGVVSWGYGCGDANYPGVYARVSSAIDWIKSVACDTWNSNGSFCGNGGNPTTPEQGGDCTVLELELRTDDYPQENSIYLTSDVDGIIWNQPAGTLLPNNDYKDQACIPNDGCAILEVGDTYGDGLIDGGYLVLTYGSQELFNNKYEDVGFGFTVALGDGC